MFKKSLVSLLLVLMVLLMALPITAFASENQDPAILSDEAIEPCQNNHTLKTINNYNNGKPMTYCTACTSVQTQITNAGYTGMATSSITALTDDEGAVIGYSYKAGGATFTLGKGTASLTDHKSGTTKKNFSVTKGNTVTITYSTAFNYVAFQLQNKITSHTGLNGAVQYFNSKTATMVDTATPTVGRAMIVIELDSAVTEYTFTAPKGMTIRNMYLGTSKEMGTEHPVHTYSYGGEVTPPTCINDGYTTKRCACGLSTQIDHVDNLGGHVWSVGDCHTPNTCDVCGEKGEYNHSWVADSVADNSASYYCEHCASYKAINAISPSKNNDHEITDENGDVVGYYFESADKAIRFDTYISASGTLPVPGDTNVRLRTDTTFVISAKEGTFSKVILYFPGNYNGVMDDKHPGNKGAYWAKEQAESGTFINYIVGIDYANISCYIEYNDQDVPTSTGVVIELNAPVSELKLKSGTDNWYNSYIHVENVIDVEGEHTHDFKPAKSPSCTETVATDFICDGCGFGYAGELAPAGHTPGAAADCENDQTCTVCGDVLVGKLGHSYDAGVETQAPTCTDDGVKTFTCANCGETKTEAIDAKGHTEGPAADCENDQTCTVCGVVLVGKLGHSYDAGVETQAPTCTEDGVKTFTCQNCDHSYTETIPANGSHSYDDGVETTAPTCTVDGEKTFTCSECGDSYTEAITAKGHTEGPAADCENDQICTVCNEVLTEKLGHKYDAVVTDPTCEKAGYTTHTCSVCQKSYTDSETDALGHSYDDGVETTAPTCTEDGVKTFTCGVCGDSYTEAIKAAGHDINTFSVHTFCEEEGYITCGCRDCGATFDSRFDAEAQAYLEELNNMPFVTIDLSAKGHTPGAAADCENDQTCTVCGDVLAGKLGHSYGTDGYCTVCGEADPDAAFVAAVNGKMYLGLDAAYAAANAGDTITLLADISESEIIVINKAITLDGNGKTLTSTAARAINIETDGNVTIKNLTINAGERAINVINKPAKVTVENISATAKNNAIMLATSAAGAQLTVNGSNLTGLAVINIASAGSAVEINDTVITNVDATDKENYGAITVWTSADSASVVVNGGSINVADGSKAAYVFPADATIALNGVADAEIGYIVAIVGDAGFETLAEALEDAKAGQTVKLVRDVSLTKTVNVAKNVTLDLNGNTISGDFTDYYGIIYVKRGATLTIEGEGAIIAKACDAIGNYGTVIVNGGNITTEADPYYGAIYNFYYTADFYGTTVINGGKVDTILNSGNLTVNGGEIAYIDNSGKLAVAGGEIGEIIAKDGTDAEGVVGAGTVEIADTAIITVPDGYDLVEIEAGVYQVLAHDYKAVVTNPDCVNGGYTTHTCVNCGDSYTDNETEALGHSYDCEETKAPTCTEDGENTFTCSKCGDSYTEAIKAHGHRYSSVKVTSATCTEDGYITLGCGNCGIEWDSRYDDEAKQYLIDNPYFNLSAKGHKHEASVTAPTCTEDGFTTYTCACGDSYTEAGEPAKGHRYNKTQVFTFCEEEGYILIDCANCGKQFDSRYDDEAKQYLIDLPFFNLAPKGHKYENGVCTNEGCNATIGRIYEAKVNLGADLGVKWYVVLPEGADVADYVFTVEFLGESFVLEATEANGRYMYFFANIAPQNMGDNMKATLTKGDASISVDAYSVKQNLLNIAENNAELKTLVADLLNYGAASQVYMGYNVDNLVNADVTFAGSDDEIVNPGYTLEGNAKENSAYFKSANVLFASTNRVVVKIVVNTNATLVVGDKTYNLAAGEYEIYSRDIAAYKLFDNVTFTLTGEDGNVTTLNYSVAAYAATKAGNETAMGNLATALYYYAKSVKDIVG